MQALGCGAHGGAEEGGGRGGLRGALRACTHLLHRLFQHKAAEVLDSAAEGGLALLGPLDVVQMGVFQEPKRRRLPDLLQRAQQVGALAHSGLGADAEHVEQEPELTRQAELVLADVLQDLHTQPWQKVQDLNQRVDIAVPHAILKAGKVCLVVKTEFKLFKIAPVCRLLNNNPVVTLRQHALSFLLLARKLGLSGHTSFHTSIPKGCHLPGGFPRCGTSAKLGVGHVSHKVHLIHVLLEDAYHRVRGHAHLHHLGGGQPGEGHVVCKEHGCGVE
mmetsp:Transcript_1558/g.2686  ORF Transcript_1558/g.2686 Transcript_1558/m.2686 type:complete len:275 (-) Transcript_1558:1464-2288(-)